MDVVGTVIINLIDILQNLIDLRRLINKYWSQMKGITVSKLLYKTILIFGF